MSTCKKAWIGLAVLLACSMAANAAKKQDDASEDSGNGGGIPVYDLSKMSDKDQWACEVALCMANPGGPTEFDECKPPIEKMYRELHKGHKIPKCKFLAGGDEGGGSGGGDNRDSEYRLQEK